MRASVRAVVPDMRTQAPTTAKRILRSLRSLRSFRIVQAFPRGLPVVRDTNQGVNAEIRVAKFERMRRKTSLVVISGRSETSSSCGLLEERSKPIDGS